jgi:hypothetical protein
LNQLRCETGTTLEKRKDLLHFLYTLCDRAAARITMGLEVIGCLWQTGYAFYPGFATVPQRKGLV